MLPSLIGIIASSGGGIATSYESIATVTVGAGGSSSVSFSSISSAYTHLQVRAFTQTNRATYGIDEIKINLNSDTGNNYASHDLYGDSSAAGAAASTSTGKIQPFRTSGTSTGGSFGVTIIDLLDYANTNKYKTVRSLGGVDFNGTLGGFGGAVDLNSGLWMNTAAITAIAFAPSAGTLFTQYSSFALYGIKG